MTETPAAVSLRALGASWPKSLACVIAAGCVPVAFGIALNVGGRTAESRAWMFLGPQILFEAFFVVRALWGGRFPGLSVAALQDDLKRGTPAAAWLMALLAGGIYSGLAAQDPVIAASLLHPSALKASVVLLATVTGLLEEAFFRRFLMDKARAAGRGSAAQVAISAAAFGLLHFGWALAGGATAAANAMAWTTILGAALAGVYIAGGRNLWPCIAAHFLINLLLEPGLALAAGR